jgi:hypothetical protein
VREAAGKPALDGTREQAEGGLRQVLEPQAWGRVALLPCKETDDLSASSLLCWHTMLVFRLGLE